jgi:large subunit ribosomal protein L13
VKKKAKQENMEKIQREKKSYPLDLKKKPLSISNPVFPHWFIIDAKGKTLGRLSTEVSKLLRGKEFTPLTPGKDQGNYVIIINAAGIEVTGKKKIQKLYYRHSQRPGSLKTETFQQLQTRLPIRILEKAIWGMLPKGVLGRMYYRRLFIYNDTTIDPYITDLTTFHQVTFQNVWKANTIS